jgi:hypothetical protein
MKKLTFLILSLLTLGISTVLAQQSEPLPENTGPMKAKDDTMIAQDSTEKSPEIMTADQAREMEQKISATDIPGNKEIPLNDEPSPEVIDPNRIVSKESKSTAQQVADKESESAESDPQIIQPDLSNPKAK